MGKVFGEFKDYMELNQAAEGLFREGDLDNLKKAGRRKRDSGRTGKYI